MSEFVLVTLNYVITEREREREREREVTQLNSGTHTETDLLVDRLGKGIFCVVYIISGEIAIRKGVVYISSGQYVIGIILRRIYY